MPSDYPIIRKPFRIYPLPDDIRDLDGPWSKEDKKRHARVDLFRKGYSYGEDPRRINPNISPSNILSKL